MEFIEKQDIFAGNMMLIDDKGNKITYGDFEDIYEKEEQLLESGTLAFLFCRNAVGSVLYYRICLRKHVVPLLLEHQMDEELLKALLETYEPEYLIGMLEDLKKPDRTERSWMDLIVLVIGSKKESRRDVQNCIRIWHFFSQHPEVREVRNW